MNAPICSSATPATSGHSCRVGGRNRPISPNTSALINAAEPKRLAASQSGLMWSSPSFMTGQLPPQIITARQAENRACCCTDSLLPDLPLFIPCLGPFAEEGESL